MDKSNFKEKLDNEHKWPCKFMFKFIVPAEKVSDLYKILQQDKVTVKKSSGGKYVSCTSLLMMKSSDEVMKIYESANKIQGLIAL